MKKNTFGDLVKAYRKQRGLTQGEVAQLWGFTREYVSQVESGKRTLRDRNEQVMRLAEILQIPPERLEAAGRNIPKAKIIPTGPQQGDDAIFQALLFPAQATVKLSWLVWSADNGTPDIITGLETLITQLDDALTKYHGQFARSAQELEAYAHEMLGKIAFDKLDFQEAGYHFQQMLELGDELQDADLIALAMVHQGYLLRKRGRFETAFRCFESARPWAMQASPYVRGTWYKIQARAYSVYGDQERFERTINEAQLIAESTDVTLDTLSNKFDLVEVLQEKAQGYTMLWQPEKALEIYKRTDVMRPFRPLRDLGSYTMVKAQAHTYVGDIDYGVQLAMRGVEMARQYGSKRHVRRIEDMYDRLSVTPIGKTQQMRELHDFLVES